MIRDMDQTHDFLYTPRSRKEVSIWRDVSDDDWNSVQWQMKNVIRNVDQLSELISLTERQKEGIKSTLNTLSDEGKEPLRITPYYALLMAKNPFSPAVLEGERAGIDPVFWQSVPTPANLLFPAAGVEEAMSEGSRSFGAAYQRYPNRVALFVGENTNCASYCVHCQRSKSLDSSHSMSTTEIDKALFYIEDNKNVNEVLVTGGDALMISKKRLRFVLESLSAMPHIRSIRIASRVPVVMPMGITDELLTLINDAANKHSEGVPKYVYFMTHINHYKEITSDLAAAVKRINKHGFTVRNQTVLLNHVNDNYRTLAETFRRMFWVGVHPYYLLQCHKERGIAHFIVPVQEGRELMNSMQGWVSGVVIPRYASNVEGGGGKVNLMVGGYDEFNTGLNFDERLADPCATVHTWDNRLMKAYEALGRATQDEYSEAMRVMNEFIGREGVFCPKVLIVDDEGKVLSVSNRRTVKKYSTACRTEMLGYVFHDDKMPLTNPNDVEDDLQKRFETLGQCGKGC